MEGANNIATSTHKIAMGIDMPRDIAGLTTEHERLAVTTDVRKQLDAVFTAHENSPIVFMGQTTPVSRVGHVFVMPNIQGGLFKNVSVLASKKRFVKIGIDVQLSASRG
jgi:hypothetical protein